MPQSPAKRIPSYERMNLNGKRRLPWPRPLVFLVLCLAGVHVSAYAQTQPVALAWDANPEGSVGGYIVYVGNASGSYVEQYDVGQQTSFVYTRVTGGRPYFFAVAAYTPLRDVGPLSDEIFFLAGTVTASEPSPIPSRTPSTLAENRSAVCAGVNGQSCYTVQRIATVPGEIQALTPAGDGRVFFIDAAGEHVRLIAGDTLMPDAVLAAARNSRLIGLVLDPAFDRNRFVYVGEVETRPDGRREMSIVRYREVANLLAEGSAIISGLPLPANGDAPFTVDGTGHVYLAMPAAAGGAIAASPYDGMVLRFESDGSVPRDSRGGSPVFAHGYARPTSLVWSGAQNELWLAGRGADWDGPLARLPLAGNAAEWPRLPGTAVLDSDSPIVSLSAARTARASSAAGGVSGSVILVDEDGTLMRVDTQTQRVAAFTTVSTTEIGGDSTFAALDGNDIYLVVSPITSQVAPASWIVRLRQN